MGLFGPYLTHRWEWYGTVTWVYGNGMGPNFTKFLTMGHVWEENLRLPILWENYGNKVPILIPYQQEFPQLSLPMALIWDIHSVEYTIDYPYQLYFIRVLTVTENVRASILIFDKLFKRVGIRGI